MKKQKSMLSPVKALKYLFKKPMTVDMKDIYDTPRPGSDRYRGFHVNDWDKCIGCGTCSEICPTNAITMMVIPELEKKEGTKQERPALDYGRCSFCGLCVDICASDSLKMSKEYLHLSIDADSFYFLPDKSGIHHIEGPKGYVRDEVSELLDLERYHMTHEGVARKDSFIEIVKGYSLEQAFAESARCVECGICTETCPAHMNIPEYIRSIYDGDLKEGVKQIYKTNPMANVCGRICTHNCETVCALTHRGEPIAIRWLKRYIVDNVSAEDYDAGALEGVTAPVNGKVGIVGSGPSGLAAAFYLRTLGYEVDVYEAKPLPGGVIRYGGPEYRLPEASVQNDIGMIQKAGVNFITNTKLGTDISLDQLHQKYDAVFLGIGFSLSRPLKIDGYEHQDVNYAIPFLAKARDYTRGSAEMPDVHEKVVVVGGGNVAFDVARTLLRLQNIKYGQSHVTITSLEDVDHLPADLEELEEGIEEGLIGDFGYGPDHIVIEDNQIKGLKVKRVLSIINDGRFNPSYDENDTHIAEGSQVYMAIGQMAEYDFFPEEMMDKVSINRGKVVVKPNGQFENYPWLFAGGDIVRGPDIINGVATGHDAANGIDEYLRTRN